MNTNTLTDELNIFKKEIIKAHDSIYGVLIAHLYIEFLLDRYLKTKIVDSAGFFGKNGFTFSNKLKLAKGFGNFDLQLINSMRKLNSIRNNCAHLFGHEITNNEINTLGITLGSDYTKIKHENKNGGIDLLVPIISKICSSLLNVTLQAEKENHA